MGENFAFNVKTSSPFQISKVCFVPPGCCVCLLGSNSSAFIQFYLLNNGAHKISLTFRCALLLWSNCSALLCLPFSFFIRQTAPCLIALGVGPQTFQTVDDLISDLVALWTAASARCWHLPSNGAQSSAVNTSGGPSTVIRNLLFCGTLTIEVIGPVDPYARCRRPIASPHWLSSTVRLTSFHYRTV